MKINHNRDKHGNVPLWVLINALSFGKISKMYSLSLDSIKQKICNEYGNISISEMSSMLSILTKFRNVCAHNGRLYNYKTKDTLPVLDIQKSLKLPMNKNKTAFRKGHNDMFAILIILKSLLSHDDFEEFYNQLLKQINDFKFKSNIVNKNAVTSEMGFPNNWQDIFSIS
ncbi:MAG: Abi family protein [Clostridia bacterium]